jgi:hypothetical protein
MAYQGYSVIIQDKDHSKAMEILEKHRTAGDIDDIHFARHFFTIDGARILIVHYRIHPYIYEDLDTIMNEFEREGIRIL